MDEKLGDEGANALLVLRASVEAGAATAVGPAVWRKPTAAADGVDQSITSDSRGRRDDGEQCGVTPLPPAVPETFQVQSRRPHNEVIEQQWGRSAFQSLKARQQALISRG